MQSLDVHAPEAVFPRALILHLNPVIAHGAVEDVKHRIAGTEHVAGRRQDHAIRRHELVRAEGGIQIPVILQNRITPDADGNRLAVRRNIVDMREVVLVHRLDIGSVDDNGNQQNDHEQRQNILLHPGFSFLQK